MFPPLPPTLRHAQGSTSSKKATSSAHPAKPAPQPASKRHAAPAPKPPTHPLAPRYPPALCCTLLLPPPIALPNQPQTPHQGDSAHEQQLTHSEPLDVRHKPLLPDQSALAGHHLTIPHPAWRANRERSGHVPVRWCRTPLPLALAHDISQSHADKAPRIRQ